MKVPIDISLIIPRCIRNLRMLALKKIFAHSFTDYLAKFSTNFSIRFQYEKEDISPGDTL